MIHNNFFVGPLGKLHNIGGSRAFTTPNTIAVPPEYDIQVNSTVQGELVAHSLNGRLWFFLDENTLYVVALKWNANKAKLEFASVKTFSNYNDTFLACGLDWVLSNNNIFSVSDENPYILRANLFDENIPDTFLYSILRAKGIGASAIDPFTHQAWGKRNDNGNSNGNGYFNKDNHLLYPAGKHSFEMCYSLLPHVGDWLLFENFLIRIPETPLTESYNDMLNIRPLIPLELSADNPACGSPVFGTGYNFDHRGIQLSYRNGIVWARGIYHIGKVSLLPAVSDKNGETLEFYLYIAPDYPCSPLLHQKIFSQDELAQNGYQFFGGHTFMFVNGYFTRSQAKAACLSEGGHLATSTSPDKNSFLKSISNTLVMLGGQRINDIWGWDNSEQWDYSNWDDGYPTSRQNNDFLFMEKSGKWQNFKSYYYAPYICEWDYDLSSLERFSNWLNMSILINEENSVYGFIAQNFGALQGEVCCNLQQHKVFDTELFSWVSLFNANEYDNPKLFLDSVSGQSMLLHDNGATFFDFFNKNNCSAYSGNNLPQWISPTENVLALLPSSVISSDDIALYACHINNGFYRERLLAKQFILTIPANSKRFLLPYLASHDKLDISVNSIQQSSEPSTIMWQDFFKQFFSFPLLHSFSASQMPQKLSGNEAIPIFLASTEENITISNNSFTVSKYDAISGWVDASDIPSPDGDDHAAYFIGGFPVEQTEYGYNEDTYPSLQDMENSMGFPLNIDDWEDFGTDLDAGVHEAGQIKWHLLTIDFDSGLFIPLADISAPIMAVVQSHSQVTKNFSYSFDWEAEYWYIDFEHPIIDENGQLHYEWKSIPDPYTASLYGALTYNRNTITRYETPTIKIENGKICVNKVKSITGDNLPNPLPRENVYYDIPEALSQLANIDTSKAPIAYYDANLNEAKFLLKFFEPASAVPYFVRVSNQQIITNVMSFIDFRSKYPRADFFLRTLVLVRLDNDVFVYAMQLLYDIFDFYLELQRSLSS